jgi:hypothetical protein
MELFGILAIVVQVVTEAIARLYPKYTVYVAGVVGIAVAFLADVGLLASLDVQATNHYADVFLAGLVLAGGAGVIQALKAKVKG